MRDRPSEGFIYSVNAAERSNELLMAPNGINELKLDGYRAVLNTHEAPAGHHQGVIVKVLNLDVATSHVGIGAVE